MNEIITNSYLSLGCTPPSPGGESRLNLMQNPPTAVSTLTPSSLFPDTFLKITDERNLSTKFFRDLSLFFHRLFNVSDALRIVPQFGTKASLILSYSTRARMCSITQSCPTLFDSMDCSPSGSSVYGISQARILEWVAISSSRGSSRPRDQTCISCVSCIGRQVLYHRGTWESLLPEQGSAKRAFKPVRHSVKIIPWR